MLKGVRRYWLPALAALVISALVWTVGISSTFRTCIDDNASRQSDNHKVNERPSIVFVAVSYRDCLGYFFDKNNPAITAFSTLIIATFTVVLAFVTNRQARLTRDSIDLASKEFISTHRPKLIVRQFDLQPLRSGHPIRVDYSVINVGSTEAALRQVAHEAALWNGKTFEAPGVEHVTKPIGPFIIRNGQRRSAMAESRFKITDAQIQAVEQKAMVIRALGEFMYTDRLGTERRTGFDRYYDVFSVKFVASDDKDQEYQD